MSKVGGIARVAGAVALGVSVIAAPATGQIAELLGPHQVETVALDGDIVSTGRIGGVAADRYGYLYVANQDGGVWKVHPTGKVELFATGFYGSGGNAVLPNGDLLQANFSGNSIVRISRDGAVHPLADNGFAGPVGIAVSAGGDAFVVNYRSNYISRVTLDGAVTEFVRDDRFEGPNGITADPQGNLYVVNLNNTLVLQVTPSGEISEIARLPGTANAHVAWSGGALYVTQIWSHAVLRVAMDGSYEVVAGDGTMGFEDGSPGESRVAYPNGIAAYGSTLYFNTLRGPMFAGKPGTIQVRRLTIPNPNQALLAAYERDGLDGLRAKFDLARNLREMPFARLAPGLYSSANQFRYLHHFEAALALVDWTADADPDELRGHVSRGRAHALYGDKDVAIQHLERALEMKPDDEDLQLLLQSVREYRR